jgi:hypothetical protein
MTVDTTYPNIIEYLTKDTTIIECRNGYKTSYLILNNLDENIKNYCDMCDFATPSYLKQLFNYLAKNRVFKPNKTFFKCSEEDYIGYTHSFRVITINTFLNMTLSNYKNCLHTVIITSVRNIEDLYIISFHLFDLQNNLPIINGHICKTNIDITRNIKYYIENNFNYKLVNYMVNIF